MEKYNLTQTGPEVQDILNNATPQSELTTEVERAQEAERALGEGVQQNADDIDAIEAKIPSAASSENKLTDKEYVDGQVDDEKTRAQGAEGTLQDNIDAEELRAKAAEEANANDIDAIEVKIPSGASSENKLATESYVNDAVSTASATFRGTFNLVSDLHLTLEATHANIATALAAAIATADNNDFAFVLVPTDEETPAVIGSIDRYKFNGEVWAYEYTLNNSGFTQEQWDAINSGITSGDVTKLGALPTNAELTLLLNGLAGDIGDEETRAKAAELALQGTISDEETRAKAAEKQNADDIDAIEEKIPSSASSSNKLATASDVDNLSAAIEAILLLIPSAATQLNQLADKAFVNSSISTATATFRGTFNLVSDLHLTLVSTHAQIETALLGAIPAADNNDYCFVQIPTSADTPTEIAKTERYKFNGTEWAYEYDLNNSGYTAVQWAAINSGITSALVAKLSALPTNADLTTALGILSTGIDTINEKIPTAASTSNKLVDTAAMVSYVTQIINALDMTYNVTSEGGHVNLQIRQEDGAIVSVAVSTTDIASEAAMNVIGDRVTAAENTILSLTSRVSINERDIALLRAQYNALTESDIVVGAKPATGDPNVIYRVPGTSTYADWMYYDGAWVKLAEYTTLDGYLYKGIATPTGSPAVSTVKMFYYALTPGTYTNFGGFVVKEGISILKYDGANWTQEQIYYGDGGVFDISKYNLTNGQPTEYVDLAAALGTNGANVPAAVRKGGMSVKFVQSSDNKYVRYNLLANAFTTDTTQWAIADEGVYVENPEFVYVKTDAEGKILWAIKIDGSIYYGAGVPQQVIDYINEKIAELSLDEYEDIVAFLNDLEKGDKTLQTLLNEKVDKEEGKSLIDAEYASTKSTIDNPEFLEVTTDSEDKVLEGIQQDGTKVIGGDLNVGGAVKILGEMEVSGVSYKVVENPEYLAAWVDADNKIIFGLKADGKTYVGDADFLDDIESIKAFLANFNDKNIDWDALTSITATENPEYIEVKTDVEYKILEATEKDGTKVFGDNVKVLGSINISGVNYKVVNSPEWLKVVLDAEDRIICGIKTDGRFVVYIADFLDDIEAIKVRLEEFDAYSVTENPEFLKVELDAYDKVLSGRKVDGTKFENNDVELNGNATIGGSLEVDGVAIKNIKDPENRSEITLDSEQKIISYRKDDGTLVENIGIETTNTTTDSLSAKEVSIEGGNATLDSLELTEQGMTDFQQALKDSGFKPGGAGNFSDAKVVELPEPIHYALLNLIVDSLPLEDEDISEGYAEYYDKSGNYWKKPIELAAQGQTSRIFARTGGKGNYTMDIVDDSEIKFSSWVPQDSFHLKGCAKDVTRGFLPTSYKLAYLMMQALDAKPNRVLVDESGITTTAASGSRMNDWPNEARCLPDGFPVEIYINGEYWGLYSWQLKKHRKNYSMNKKDYKSFFLDADGGMQDFWNGNINWTMFEIKNPKDLICMDGSAYDGDNPQELIDETAVSIYDATNKKHTGSKQTKDIIKSFSTKYLEVKALVDANTPESLAEAKTKFADYFDVNACIFVYIFNPIMANSDSVNKNTLWGTYNNGKIVPMLWDLDSVYGEPWDGIFARTPDASMFNGQYATATWPLALLWKLYKDEIKAAYKELRDDGIISMDTWRNVIYNQWVNRIGQTAYERDIKKWPETPSYRENYTNSEYWQEVERNIAVTVENAWSESTQYNVGDTACLKMYPTESIGIKYRAIQANTNVCPVTKFYTGFPQVGGYYNSPKRMEKWMETQIQLCDIELEYNNN